MLVAVQRDSGGGVSLMVVVAAAAAAAMVMVMVMVVSNWLHQDDVVKLSKCS